MQIINHNELIYILICSTLCILQYKAINDYIIIIRTTTFIMIYFSLLEFIILFIIIFEFVI